MSQLQEKYQKEIRPALQKKLEKKSPIAVPALEKIVLNMGTKDALSDKKYMQSALSAMTQIAGQKPKIAKAKKSIASFKLRQGDEIGVTVTLRGKRMYNFFEKLVGIVLPRLRDFRGVRKTSFDGRGNYTLGFSEHTVFAEIDPGKVDKVRGLEVCIVTTARDTAEAYTLLEALGMPFQKG